MSIPGRQTPDDHEPAGRSGARRAACILALALLLASEALIPNALAQATLAQDPPSPSADVTAANPDALFCTDAMQTQPDTDAPGADPFAADLAAFVHGARPFAPRWRVSLEDGCQETGQPVSA